MIDVFMGGVGNITQNKLLELKWKKKKSIINGKIKRKKRKEMKRKEMKRNEMK